MKKKVNLSDSDLNRLVRKIISEENNKFMSDEEFQESFEDLDSFLWFEALSYAKELKKDPEGMDHAEIVMFYTENLGDYVNHIKKEFEDDHNLTDDQKEYLDEWSLNFINDVLRYVEFG